MFTRYLDPDSSERRSIAMMPAEERFRMLVEAFKDYAILLLDVDGYIASWNPGVRAIQGYSAEELVGQHFSIFYPTEAIQRRWPEIELERARANGRFEDEGWRLRKDGSRFWANVIINAIHDRGGTLVGFAKITRDLTERKRQEESVRESEERFRLLVEGVRDYAIFLLDPAGYVSSWNAGAERIKGYSATEIIGRHFSQFYPPEEIERGKPARQLLLAREKGRVEDEGWRVRKDGSRFWANVVITALRNDDGQLVGFAKLTRDLTERKRVEALEDERRRMNQFLAMLAHELRNPLAPIRNAVGVMQEKSLEDPNLRWSRDVIDRQISHLTRLVDDLLDVSRITRGKITLQREPLDVSIIVARAVEASRPHLDARRHRLEISLPGEVLMVYGDLTRLAQVVMNLVNNSAKYTPDAGEIRVSARREGDFVEISVSDNGIGISREFMPSLFDLFTQGENIVAGVEGGLGIGLTLVKQIVEMHGGTVTAFSEGLNKGSEFRVKLPLMKGAEQPNGSAPASEAEVPARVKGLRVLVVDDNRDSAETMAMLFRLWGHEVHVVYDGISALAAARHVRPDVVFLDIGLPSMSGYEVAEELRRSDAVAHTTLVAVTGYGKRDDRLRSRQAGFAHHLVKPVERGIMQELLQKLLRDRARLGQASP